ncbi:AcrR family transcriptional regulator [Pararhizobium capsulatum DSM 1112]|uniref:AcrR family transcriptional regulator n=1 Tax=Pararhizobium capsulatum DSM 1112 TaxID=1121113 RepID=A0ABU0BJC6_9HYPH|nr:TetR/AcrR family transcriptional regulator [Pararhizobium capsulatum]MDQ0318348.1 AcrR family transcriptional regulator [Pararhizobium capsulatum DSM 1112]
MNTLPATCDLLKPARGRPRAFDVDAVLDGAIAVFSERGYHGTSIGDLANAMGLTTGSIYKAFDDKRGVLLAAFARYRKVRRTLLLSAIAHARTGREKIRAVLGFYADAACGGSGQRGCLVVATATELAATDALAARDVDEAHASNEGLLRDLILLGQQDGSIGVEIDAQATARTMLCLQQGMRVVGKTDSRSREDMARIVDVAMAMLG